MKEVDKLSSLARTIALDSIENIVSDPIYALDDDFWTKIKEPYILELT